MTRARGNPNTTVLCLPAEESRRLARWAGAGYPAETCGCLLGSREGGCVQVRRARLGRNLLSERAHDRFELDPGDLVRAEDDARARGLEVVGIWHSHADQAAAPSEADRAGAWEGWSHVIVSVAATGVSGVRSWRLARGGFREEEIRPGA